MKAQPWRSVREVPSSALNAATVAAMLRSCWAPSSLVSRCTPRSWIVAAAVRKKLSAEAGEAGFCAKTACETGKTAFKGRASLFCVETDMGKPPKGLRSDQGCRGLGKGGGRRCGRGCHLGPYEPVHLNKGPAQDWAGLRTVSPFT